MDNMGNLHRHGRSGQHLVASRAEHHLKCSLRSLHLWTTRKRCPHCPAVIIPTIIITMIITSSIFILIVYFISIKYYYCYATGSFLVNILIYSSSEHPKASPGALRSHGGFPFSGACLLDVV